MKPYLTLLLLPCLSCVLPAQETEGLLTAPLTPAATETAPAAAESIVADTPAALVQDTQPAAAPELPQAEQLVRSGVLMLNQVQEILSNVRDQDSAEAAVAPLMRLHAKLQDWARAFAALPPLTEEEQRVYEERYLPIIEKLNNRIRTQGERLGSAEYYGSRNLPAVLIRLALLNQ